jgi:hypothetical protein
MPVVNYYKSIVRNKPQPFWPKDYVYIGRPGKGLGGPFGNPIKVKEICPVCGETHEKPVDTLACYEKWLKERVEQDDDFRFKVKGLLSKKLVCFCAPKPCHGDILERVSAELNFLDTDEDD